MCDGIIKGLNVGEPLGWNIGCIDGYVGEKVGILLGVADGIFVGVTDGISVGGSDGANVGHNKLD